MERKAVTFAIAGLLIISVLGIAFDSDLSVEAQAHRGPRIDTLRYKVTHPTNALLEMTPGPPGGSDVYSDANRPTAIEEFVRQGKPIFSRNSLHYAGIIINMRVSPLNDVHFRHALAHLVPKDTIINNLYKYTVAKVSTPVPPAYGAWYNPSVDPHPYDPAEAMAILSAGGYQFTRGSWKNKDGSALPRLRFYSLMGEVSPTAYEEVYSIVREANSIGLTNIVQHQMDQTVMLDEIYNYGHFELAWVSHNLGKFPTHLFRQFSSEENYLGSSNPHGISYPALDAQLSLFMRSLDPSTSRSAALTSQELIMGGTTSMPLPRYVPLEDSRSHSLPEIPIYANNNYATQQPELRGAVNMFARGIANRWSLMNIYWPTTNNYRPGTSEKTVVWILSDYPERLNPLWALSVPAWDCMKMSYDGLIETNPYTLRDEPWLATSWSYVPTAEGMDVTFNLRLTDLQGQPIKWQDGKEISIEDVKFSWDFIAQYQIPKFWGGFRFYDSADIVDADTITAHIKTTSQWILYDLAAAAYLVPPQVWTVDPRDGLPWTGLTEITTFDPSMISYPTAYNTNPGPLSLPTQVFGTGPFILQHSSYFVNMNHYGDMSANRDYWMTNEDIMNKIEYMFWRAGDAVNNDKIDVADLDLISVNYGQTVPPANLMADITGPAGSPPDQIVDIDDLATVGKYFGETETVPYEYGTPP